MPSADRRTSGAYNATGTAQQMNVVIRPMPQIVSSPFWTQTHAMTPVQPYAQASRMP